MVRICQFCVTVVGIWSLLVVGGAPPCNPATEGDCPVPPAATVQREHVLLQHKLGSMANRRECTPEGQDPYYRGFRPCCWGLSQKLGQWNAPLRWSFRCVAQGGGEATTFAPPSQGFDDIGTPRSQQEGRDHRLTEPVEAPEPAPCTAVNDDPWKSGKFVACCEDLVSMLRRWLGKDKPAHYRCVPDEGDEPAEGAGEAGEQAGEAEEAGGEAAAPERLVPEGPQHGSPFRGAGPGFSKVMVWDVHHKNKGTGGIAGIVAANSPDIVCINELTIPVLEMAAELSRKMNREFKPHPHASAWQGYGGDLFYDSAKWEGLDGGLRRAFCDSRGGPRVANFMVLREKATGKEVIVGGVHLSYCGLPGCDELHACELNTFYGAIESAQKTHAGASVLLLGDMSALDTSIMVNLLAGKVGSRDTVPLEDLSRVAGRTYFEGGPPVDFVLGQAGSFEVVSGGRAGQGVDGQKLVGAAHFPVYAFLKLP